MPPTNALARRRPLQSHTPFCGAGWRC